MTTDKLSQSTIQYRMKQTKQADQFNLNGGNEMNKKNVWFWMVIRLALVLIVVLMLAGCSPRLRVGALQSKSQSVDLGGAQSVRAEISFGAGDLEITGGAEKLMDADFTYNVARLKPEVAYTDGTLVIRQPESDGMPALKGITGFRNEWDLRLNDEVPMDLRLDMGAGTSNLKLAGLSLTGLDISLGASSSTINLNGDWKHDLDATIDAGAANVTVRLPKDIGVRVEVDAGPVIVETQGLTKDGGVYTNAAYGTSEVTLRVHLQAGIGHVFLEVED
jgi:hypothetical protein